MHKKTTRSLASTFKPRASPAGGGNVLKDGYLTQIVETVFATNGKNFKDKLSTSQLKRIATIYGHLAKDHDLYELLFEQPKQLLEVDGSKVHTRDLAMFTMMDHSFARGYYWKPDTSNATTDPSVNPGVPLAFMGARQVFGKKYMDWIPDTNIIRCDIFLPKGLNSMEINEEGTPVSSEEVGLLAFYQSDIPCSLEDIRELRSLVPATKAAHSPRKVKGLSNTKLQNAYNKASKRMRCLLLQRWCWSGGSRCADMITDFRDWDNLMPNVDNTFKELKPTDNKMNPGILAFMGEK